MLRRIPLGKMNNLRDLGGYPAGDGVTVWERFLRGDNPAGLSEQDIQWLRERDITTIVDLRSGEELARQPDQLRGQPGFLYHHCPLVGIEKLPNLEADIGRAYFEAMDRLTCVGRAMRILAAAPGGVLFHCTAGKDRTGVVAALLLWLAGVSEEDILDDYIVSGPYLQQMLRAYCEAHPGAVVCPPQSAYMSSFLRLFAQRYGTPRQYLEMLGVDAGKLAEKLRPKEL